MAQMTGGEAVLQALRHEGVEIVFGLPGVQIMGLYDAFYARSDIRIMTCGMSRLPRIWPMAMRASPASQG